MGGLRRFFDTVSQTASVSSYVGIFGDPSINLPGVQSLSSLSSEAVQIITWIRYKLGEPVLYVELHNNQIYAAFEEANIKYSSLINTFQIRNWMTSMYGLSKDFSVNDLSNKLPFNQFNFLKRQVQAVGTETYAYVGGNQEVRKAYTTTDSSTQDYNILTDFIDDVSGSSMLEYLNSVSGNVNGLELDIKTIFHYSPITLYRFYDPFSSINLLSQEFNFESFNTETIFYVLPLWNDILRAQQLNLNDKVRRSNISYARIGDIIRLYPRPLRPTKLWIEFMVKRNPYSPMGSLSADPSLSGISNMSNVPFKDIKYQDVNPIARNWIRQYTFAISMEELGRIRRKFKSIPIPNGDINLDGDELVREGIERQSRLEDQLSNDLEKLTNVSLMRQEAEQADLINKQLQYIPNIIHIY